MAPHPASNGKDFFSYDLMMQTDTATKLSNDIVRCTERIEAVAEQVSDLKAGIKDIGTKFDTVITKMSDKVVANEVALAAINSEKTAFKYALGVLATAFGATALFLAKHVLGLGN